MRKTITLLGIMLFISLTLIACGNKGGSSSENNATKTEEGNKYLKVWVPTEELDITKEMCDMFLEKYGYDSLTIECLGMSSGDSIQGLTVDRSTAADLFLYSTCDGRGLVDAGLVLPIALNYDELKVKFNATAFEAATFDDFLYGIPIQSDTWVMYYNKEIFSDEDVKSIDRMLSKDTGILYNFSCSISSNWFIESFFYAKDCTLFGEDGKQPGQCTWNNTDGFQVSKYLIELINNPSYYEDMSGDAYEYLLKGELGAFCSSEGSAVGLKEAMGDKLGVTKLPEANIDGEDVQLRSFVDYTVFGVNSYTKYPKEAQELAIWLGGKECQMMRYEQLGVIPTLTELLENEMVKGNVVSGAVTSQLEHCVIVPKIREMQDYWASATALGEGIAQGTIIEENVQHYLDVFVENIAIEFVAD